MARKAWEKNWLLKHGWSLSQIATMEKSGDETPVEYLTGAAEFCGWELAVTPATLIPRIETEKLVTLVWEYIQTKVGGKVKILEIGTGSGAIAVAIAQALEKAKRDYEIVATEISESALKIAKENVKRYHLEKNIKLQQTDLLKNVDWTGQILIANLPYIPEKGMQNLPKSVSEFEPQTALAGGKDGLKLIKKLLNSVIRRAKLPAAIFLEIDEMHTEKDFANWSMYKWEIMPDWQEKNRYAVGKLTCAPNQNS